MNERQTKIKILMLQTADWIFFLGTVSLGIYSFLYSDKPAILGAAAFLGLLIVNRIGNFTSGIIARYRVDLDIERKRQKREQI
jgi:hypothetical protein